VVRRTQSRFFQPKECCHSPGEVSVSSSLARPGSSRFRVTVPWQTLFPVSGPPSDKYVCRPSGARPIKATTISRPHMQPMVLCPWVKGVSAGRGNFFQIFFGTPWYGSCMAQCVAKTTSGRRCQVPADGGSEFCHIHNPTGRFRKQHPSMRVALWDEPQNPRKREKPLQPRIYEPLVPADPCETRVFTDGGCWPNPGRGGWAWVMEDLPSIHGSGREEYTTNQRMELKAALEAMRCLGDPLTIVSDSRYLVDCFNQNWWHKWVKNDWMRQEKGEWFEVKNRDLWEPLVKLITDGGNFRFLWVKGHAGNEWNELADELAAAAVYGVAVEDLGLDREDLPDGVDLIDMMPMALRPMA
jgi:ribonuclease HI